MSARSLLAATLATMLAACTSQERLPVAPFNPSDAEYARRIGSATVRGQLFLRRKDGVVVYGAGSEVRLLPRIASTDAAMTSAFQGGKLRIEALVFGANILGNDIRLDPGIEPYTKRTRANGQGNFVFDGVAPGPYYVLGRVTWCAPSQSGCDQQGGDLLETITVAAADKTASVVMSGM